MTLTQAKLHEGGWCGCQSFEAVFDVSKSTCDYQVSIVDWFAHRKEKSYRFSLTASRTRPRKVLCKIVKYRQRLQWSVVRGTKVTYVQNRSAAPSKAWEPVQRHTVRLQYLRYPSPKPYGTAVFKLYLPCQWQAFGGRLYVHTDTSLCPPIKLSLTYEFDVAPTLRFWMCMYVHTTAI